MINAEIIKETIKAEIVDSTISVDRPEAEQINAELGDDTIEVEITDDTIQSDIKEEIIKAEILEENINVTLTEIDLKTFETVFGSENEVIEFTEENITSGRISLKYVPFCIIGVRVEGDGGSLTKDIHYTIAGKDIIWQDTVIEDYTVGERIFIAYIHKQ